MSATEDAKQKAAATYNAASDFFDHPANTFWERYGRRTIERLRLADGARVLDVCCGSGASAIPAAEAVGPHGSVIGVDLADNLLDLARAKAKQRGLTNVQFESGDMTDLRFETGTFDVVVCVFGIFFVPDMEEALRWAMILGSGYRGTVDQLSASEREQVHADNLDFIRREEIRSIDANVMYAIGKKH
jgi:ubiquinone/menaquinone biosynthesis C-methylase UbiE